MLEAIGRLIGPYVVGISTLVLLVGVLSLAVGFRRFALKCFGFGLLSILLTTFFLR